MSRVCNDVLNPLRLLRCLMKRFILQSSKDQVFGCEFNTHTDGSIVTYGKGHINFWTLEGSQLTKKQGLFEVKVCVEINVSDSEITLKLNTKSTCTISGMPVKNFVLYRC